MFLGMPLSSFLVFLSWPFIYIILALIIYQIMKKQDAEMDDLEFDNSGKGKASGGGQR